MKKEIWLGVFLIVVLAAGTAGAQSFSEGFDDITTLGPAGWVFTNNSNPTGVVSWAPSTARELSERTDGRFQGSDTVFTAQTGAATAYIGDNFNACGNGVISDWLLTPEFCFIDGDTVSFWTRTPTGSAYADRLELRLSGNGSSTDVGSTDSSVGDFTTLLVEVNPTLAVGGYPEVWTEFPVTISGFPTATCGRLGFRYWVTDAGPAGLNSNYIGVDTLVVTSTVPVELMSFFIE